MSQQKGLTECTKCKEKGVPNQYLDFEQINGQWIRYDHGTKSQHSHRKPCDNCGHPIKWDGKEGRYRDNVDPFDLHNCKNDPERYAKPPDPTLVRSPVEQMTKAPEKLETSQGTEDVSIRNTKLETVSINTVAETNPIQQAIEKPKEESGIAKKVDLMWALVKNINEKTDKIAAMETTMENLINSINKYFEKTDQDIAKLAGAKFVTGTGKEVKLPSASESEDEPETYTHEFKVSEPSEEEIRKMDAEDEESIPREDDDIPESELDDQK